MQTIGPGGPIDGDIETRLMVAQGLDAQDIAEEDNSDQVIPQGDYAGRASATNARG